MILTVRAEAKRQSIEDSEAYAKASAESQLAEALALKLCPCGRTFRPYRSYQRFCSDAHRVKYTKLRASTYVKKPTEKRECKNCGETFETNDDKKHYCSSECYHAFQLKRRSPKETRTCFHCGETFESSHWAKRYCSEACRIAARKGK